MDSASLLSETPLLRLGWGDGLSRHMDGAGAQKGREGESPSLLGETGLALPMRPEEGLGLVGAVAWRERACLG